MVAAPDELERARPDAHHIDCGGGLLTPGLVDSHTHAVFGRPRYEEQEMRAAGIAYMVIARRGGGIHASVRDVRSRGLDDLVDLAEARLRRLASYGTTTVEVKSGYGLTLDDELKLLRAIAVVSTRVPMRVVPTWLGAHEIPLECRERGDRGASYVKMLVHEMLPAVAHGALAQFADVFCEPGVFTTEQARELLEASRSAGMGLKLHADELEPSGGAELAAELGAVSADHLAAVSSAGSLPSPSPPRGDVASRNDVFLDDLVRPCPGALEAGAAVAWQLISTPEHPYGQFPSDPHSGRQPAPLSVAEVIIAATVNGAAALGIADQTGQIAPGFSADLALFDCEDIRELPYWYGDRRCRGTWVRGETCHPSSAPIS